MANPEPLRNKTQPKKKKRIEPGTEPNRTRVRDQVAAHLNQNYRPIRTRDKLWIASQERRTSVSAVPTPERVPIRERIPVRLAPTASTLDGIVQRLFARPMHAVSVSLTASIELFGFCMSLFGGNGVLVRSRAMATSGTVGIVLRSITLHSR